MHFRSPDLSSRAKKKKELQHIIRCLKNKKCENEERNWTNTLSTQFWIKPQEEEEEQELYSQQDLFLSLILIPQGHDPNSQRSINWSISRFSSSQMRPTRVYLLRVFFFFFFFFFQKISVREINCGNWLARGCMPAHQHCGLFYPLGWGSAWVCRKLGNAPVHRFLGHK